MSCDRRWLRSAPTIHGERIASRGVETHAMGTFIGSCTGSRDEPDRVQYRVSYTAGVGDESNPARWTSVTDAERLLPLIAESLPEAVLLFNSAGIITFLNQAFERLFGYTREELVGQPVEHILTGAGNVQSSIHNSLVTLATALKSGEARHLVGRRRDGSEFGVDVRLNTVVVGDASFVVAVVAEARSRDRATSGWTLGLDEQLEFERLVAELSAGFINLPAARVGDEIREALRRIGEALALDRCIFLRLRAPTAEPDSVAWERPGVAPAPPPTSDGFPFTFETVFSGEVLRFSNVTELPNPIDRDSYRALGVRSAVTLPLSVGGAVVGAVAFHVLSEDRAWPNDVMQRLNVLATAFGNALSRRDSDDALHRALTEVERLRAQLHQENLYLRAEARERLGSAIIVGQGGAIAHVLDQVRQVATTGSTVLLLGETGTGKELFATQIHELSSRSGHTMVRVNCSAIPSTLMESELFGREKGAFTGALARQVGRFELADQSTIFLDEIGDLPLDIQVKLLRVLEERQIERLGNPKPIRVDVRIIAATHRQLEQRVAEGAFREDLFYRLNVFPIRIPPLRERAEDIPLLVWRFVEEFSRAFGKTVEAIPRENLEALQRYHWPGNIRELRNVVERAMIVATTSRLTIGVPLQVAPPRTLERLDEVEKEHIRSVLELTGWRIRGPAGAADRLGLRPTTLETRMAKLGLKRPKAPGR
jgi:formate hydrogenlyase transcriptional activator